MKLTLLIMLTGFCPVACGQLLKGTIPRNFVANYYQAYSNVPTAVRLLPFYADSVIIDDPTYDWVGKGRDNIFQNFDHNNRNNYYTWRIDQQIAHGDTLVTEGLLKASYAGAPYEMRFVNIFHFKKGKIIKQYDYYDNKEWHSVVDTYNKNNMLEKDKSALTHLKTVEWPKAYREQDAQLLDRILADEFKMIDSQGKLYTKKDEIAYVKGHKPEYISFEFKIERLDIFENNTAVVSGTGIIQNRDKTGNYTFMYQSSNTFIKRNGEWKAISSHTSGDRKVRGK